MAKTPKRPIDPNKLAHMIAGIATSDKDEDMDYNKRAKSIVDLATMDDEDRKKLKASMKKDG